MKRSCVVVETVNDEVIEECLILNALECRDTQISCIAAESLAKPPEARRPQGGFKAKAPKHPEVLAGPLGTHPTGRPSFLT
jgi:hypothetical protein